ncbi:MAG: hypothetical protein JSS91_00925 [Bacteroidetes bacterium]|nr:hypothetical protein [Bacteroidota bacterium]
MHNILIDSVKALDSNHLILAVDSIKNHLVTDSSSVNNTFLWWSWDNWKFFNTFAPWLSAIGTLTVAYLTYRYIIRTEKIIILSIETDVSLLQFVGINYIPQKISITVTNKNMRKATIQHFGFYINGLTYQLIPRADGVSSICPITLQDGESAIYVMDNLDFIEAINKINNGQVETLKVYVKTSTGKIFTNKISNGVINVLKSEIAKVKG